MGQTEFKTENMKEFISKLTAIVFAHGILNLVHAT